MDDSFLMGVVNRPGDDFDQGGRPVRVDRFTAQRGGQAPPVHIFQGAERTPRVFSHFVDLHDVRVLEGGDHLGLGPKAADLVVRPRPANHLQRDGTLEPEVECPIHHPHAASA